MLAGMPKNTDSMRRILADGEGIVAKQKWGVSVKSGVALPTWVIIIHCTLLLPSFACAGNESQDLLDTMRYLETKSAMDEQKLFRPTPQEREAVSKLIDMKPRPKTFNEADIKYLKGLLDKTSWFGTVQGSRRYLQSCMRTFRGCSPRDRSTRVQ